MDVIESVARAIAAMSGDDYDQIPNDKSEWNRERGQFQGRFRDINEPFKGDYLDMAKTAIDTYEASRPNHD